MRILLLTQWFDPEPTFKGRLFAEELQRLGHEVQVLTGFPNYPGGSVYPGYKVRLFQRETINGVRVLRVPLYPSHDKSAVRRSLNYLTFAVAATFGIFGVRRPDIAYVHHPPASVALPAIALKWFRGVPFIYDIQDLWPESLVATGMVRQGPLLRLVDAWMRRVYESAAHLVVLSNGFRETLLGRGIPEARVTVIPNWTYEHDDLPALDTPAASSSHPFHVVFAGTMGFAQALDTVLLSAQQLQGRAIPVRFTFVGGGVEAERLRSSAQALGLENVVFLSRRPSSEMGPIFGSADALLVHLKDDPLFAITIPSKTQAYLRAGKPILMGVRGDAARMVNEAGAGIVFEPENQEALTGAITQMRALSVEARAAMGRSGREFYVEKLSLTAGAAAFARIFEVKRYVWHRRFAIKRIIDLLGAAAGLLVLAIPMVLIGWGIARKMGRPVLFRQERPGRNGRPFLMFKFRTMTDARDAAGMLLPDRDRLTRLGSWLRATSLDELPELINVLRGEMSLVGPRPLLMRYTPFFTEQEALRMAVRPGITGLAQVSGRNLVSWDERLALDIRYVKQWSLWLDIRVLVLTIVQVFSRKGVVVDAESTMLNLDDERGGRPS